MFTRKRTLIGGGILAIVILATVGGLILRSTLLSDDAPSQASIDQAVASLSAAQPTQTAAGTPGPSQADDLAGTWILAANGDSFVGYRVQEELARVGSTTAVGRTRDITATLEFDGRAITDVRVEANLTTLRSDNSLRDGQLRRQALETDRYPTANFVLTQPIVLDGVPAEGESVSATALGDLTLHGVTRPVSIDLQGQRSNGYVVVAGSMEIRFADFGIAPPTALSVLSVEDRGIMELQLVFERDRSQG
jgi:polyisoprenoid-binding protein YceI